MSPAAIQHQVLEDLRRLPANLQQQILELVHAMVLSMSPGAPQQDLLRFEIDHPLNPPQPHPSFSTDSPIPAGSEPHAILDELRLLVSEGQILAARRLAASGAARFPEEEELCKAQRILNGGKSVVSSGGPAPSMEKELRWLADPPDWARGKWVALIGKDVVASSESLSDLAASLQGMDLPREPLVHRID